ncbi:MAG: hypothetical protein ACSW8D_08015 [Prevotella sp.]
MSATSRAKRSDALFQGDVSRRWLCDRTARLEELLAIMPKCWNAECEDCPMVDGGCSMESELRLLGIKVE